jgi:hypothetical protein
MTQLRIQKDAISNVIDAALAGIGHRGSSFMDFDAVSHDLATGRFLVQELKRQGERLNRGQRIALSALAEIPAHFTVWIVIVRPDGRFGWIDWRVKRGAVIDRDEYRGRFAAWWDNTPYVRPTRTEAPPEAMPVVAPVVHELMADEIHW